MNSDGEDFSMPEVWWPREINTLKIDTTQTNHRRNIVTNLTTHLQHLEKALQDAHK